MMVPGIISGTPASSYWLNYVRAVLPPLEAIESNLRQALKTGTLTNQGPYAEEFESALASYFDLSNVVVLGNATIGISLALQALGLDRGQVIMPSFTFAASGDAVVWAGLEPIFADIKADTMCLDPIAVEELITPDVVAIMPVHPFGGLCDIEAFAKLSNQHNLSLIYDSAQAVGIRYNNQFVGRFGDAEIFSLHATKILPTGEGCFVNFKSPVVAASVRSTRNFGLSEGNEQNFIGFNGKITEFSAMLGLCGLETLAEHITTRANAEAQIREKLSCVPGIIWQQLEPGVHTNHQNLTVRIEEHAFGLNATDLAKALRYDNINARRYFHPCLHQMPSFANFKRGTLTVSEEVTTQVISLPLYSDMTDEEAMIVADAVLAIHENATAVKAAL